MPNLRLHHILLIVSTALVIIGIAMTFSTTVVTAASYGSPFKEVIKEVIALSVGVVAAVAVAKTPVERLLPLVTLLTTLGIAAIFVAKFFGPDINGANRWLPLGSSLRVQPSEFVRVILPVYVALYLGQHDKEVQEGKDLNKVPLLFILPATIGVIASPDLEGAILMALVGMIPLILSGLNWRLVTSMAIVGGGGVLGGLFLTGRSYRLDRIKEWIGGGDEPVTSQVMQGMMAINRGGLFGVGPGAGQSQWGRVPNRDTDFIYAVIGEEYGLVGALIVIALYVAILVVGYKLWKGHPTPFGRYAGLTLAIGISLQAFINMASVVGVIPVTGLTLPLISTGGSSKVAVLCALGLMYRLCTQWDEGTMLSPDPDPVVLPVQEEMNA